MTVTAGGRTPIATPDPARFAPIPSTDQEDIATMTATTTSTHGLSAPDDRFERWRPLVGDEVDVYRRAGFGREAGFGKQPAILVVDMTYLFVDPDYVVTSGSGGAEAVRHTAELLAVARRSAVPIFYSKRTDRKHRVGRGALDYKWSFTSDEAWLNDPRCDEFPPEIAPHAEDVVVEKTKPSAFFETPLRGMLQFLRVDTLVTLGISTSGCVRAAVSDAFACNLRVIVPEECCFDRSRFAHDANLFDMDMKFADVDPVETVMDRIASGGPWDG